MGVPAWVGGVVLAAEELLRGRIYNAHPRQGASARPRIETKTVRVISETSGKVCHTFVLDFFGT